jgi:hypothetical protein
MEGECSKSLDLPPNPLHQSSSASLSSNFIFIDSLCIEDLFMYIDFDWSNKIRTKQQNGLLN